MFRNCIWHCNRSSEITENFPGDTGWLPAADPHPLHRPPPSPPRHAADPLPPSPAPPQARSTPPTASAFLPTESADRPRRGPSRPHRRRAPTRSQITGRRLGFFHGHRLGRPTSDPAFRRRQLVGCAVVCRFFAFSVRPSRGTLPWAWAVSTSRSRGAVH
jgi:hypothetical protein